MISEFKPEKTETAQGVWHRHILYARETYGLMHVFLPKTAHKPAIYAHALSLEPAATHASAAKTPESGSPHAYRWSELRLAVLSGRPERDGGGDSGERQADGE